MQAQKSADCPQRVWSCSVSYFVSLLLWCLLTGSGQWVRTQLHLCQGSRAAQYGESLSCRLDMHCCGVGPQCSHSLIISLTTSVKCFFFSLFIFLISSQFVVFSWRPCPKYYKCIHHLWQISHHCCHSPHQSQIGLMLESAGRINWCPSVFVCAVCRREWAGRQTGLSKRTQLSSMCHLLWWDWCSVSSPLRPWGERN